MRNLEIFGIAAFLCFAAMTTSARADLTFETPAGWSKYKITTKTREIDDKAQTQLVAMYVPEGVKDVQGIVNGDVHSPYIAIFAFDDRESYSLRIDYIRQHMDNMSDWALFGSHPDSTRVIADDEVKICHESLTAHRFKFVQTAYTTRHPHAVEEIFVDNGPQRYLAIYAHPSETPEDQVAVDALRSILPSTSGHDDASVLAPRAMTVL